MKSSKKILAAGVLSAFLLAPVPSYATDVFVNDQPLEKSHEVLLQDGRSFVPLRAISEALGCEVGWNGAEQEITVQKDPLALKLHLGSKVIEKSVNGESSTLTVDVPPLLKENRTYVPLRYVSEMLGLDVKWNEKEQLISIRDKAVKAEEKTEVKAEKTEKKDDSALKEDKAKKTDKNTSPKTSFKSIEALRNENKSIDHKLSDLTKEKNKISKELNEEKWNKRAYYLNAIEDFRIKTHIAGIKDITFPPKQQDQLGDDFGKFEEKLEKKVDAYRKEIKEKQEKYDKLDAEISKLFEQLRQNNKAIQALGNPNL